MGYESGIEINYDNDETLEFHGLKFNRLLVQAQDFTTIQFDDFLVGP